MGCLNVRLGYVEVFFAHIQGGVAEQGLQGVDVAAETQEVNGEGVAKAVGVNVMDAGALSDGVELLQQAKTIQGVVIVGGEERIILGSFADGVVFPDDLGGAIADGQDALF